jgi:hypothetical protein
LHYHDFNQVNIYTMKSMKIFLIGILLGFALTLYSQTTLSESPKAGPEYNVLDAWTGIWNIQGEARDSISGPYYHVNCNLNGKRILNGFALEISHKWETKSFIQTGIEVTGYDPIKKICITHIFYSDGSWLNSTPLFTGERTYIENGVTYYPNGKVDIWRNTWNFSEDWMSLKVIGESMKNDSWWKAFEGSGIKSFEK